MFLSNYNDWRQFRHRGRQTAPAAPVAGLTLEYEKAFQQVVDEIRSTYLKFFFREPLPEEITRHADWFGTRLPSAEEQLRAVREGRIRPYLGIRPLSVEIDLT